MDSGLSSEAGSRLVEAKARVVAIRERARRDFLSDKPAAGIVAQIARETETIIIDFFRSMLEGLRLQQRKRVEQNTAVVKIGGFGRGEMAPYSDVDLMFLHRGTIDKTLTDALGRVVRDCWDSGIKLGHTVQTLRDAVRLARTDITFATAATEACLLCGDAQLLNDFLLLFRRKVVDGRLAAFSEDCLATREKERRQFGATVSQVQPNIKRSPGGLRDLHLIRWFGFAHYQTRQIKDLARVWALSEEDVQALRDAHEYLMRIRCDLHFSAGGAHDVLSREDQLRIAAERGYEALPGQQPVERFMKEYYQHASMIEEIADRLTSLEKPQPLGTRIVSSILPSRTEDIFVVSAGQIDVQPDQLEELCANLDRQVSLFSLSARTGLPPAPSLLREMGRLESPTVEEISERAAADFLTIMGTPGQAGSTLRMMYKAGVLEQIVPAMSRARGMLEFNEYHQFTVDEHSLRAVEAAESFEGEASLLGQVYGEVKQKEILHLALLLHDLGKGGEKDHSQAGGEIAQEVAHRLGLSDAKRDLLVFLVQEHLAMSHQAFRRDITDSDIVLSFTEQVGSADQLRSLYVLTAADIVAVGPGTWTDWKGQLLGELYERSMLMLSGIRPDLERPSDPEERAQELRSRVEAFVSGSPIHKRNFPNEPWLAEALQTLPEHYLTSTPVEQTVIDLATVSRLGPQEAIVDWQREPAGGTVRYRIVTHDSLVAACFSKISGVMSAMGLEIVTADICTTTRGIVIDKFRVVDLEHPEGTPDIRLNEVRGVIRDVLMGRRTVKTLFAQRARLSDSAIIGPPRPPQIVVDNSSSERCTIIDVFARNRLGLLYAITVALADLGESVQLAKIATYGDTVVDVFYITDDAGNKLEDADRLEAALAELRQRVEDFDRFGLDAVPV